MKARLGMLGIVMFVAVLFATAGEGGNCVPIPTDPVPTEEVCDSIDNDLDGYVDECDGQFEICTPTWFEEGQNGQILPRDPVCARLCAQDEPGTFSRCDNNGDVMTPAGDVPCNGPDDPCPMYFNAIEGQCIEVIQKGGAWLSWGVCVYNACRGDHDCSGGEYCYRDQVAAGCNDYGCVPIYESYGQCISMYPPCDDGHLTTSHYCRSGMWSAWPSIIGACQSHDDCVGSPWGSFCGFEDDARTWGYCQECDYADSNYDGIYDGCSPERPSCSWGLVDNIWNGNSDRSLRYCN